MTFLLRGLGLALLLLGPLHAVFWRVFHWGDESQRLTPLNARVFVAHLMSVVFVLMAIGALLLFRPELLMAKSELARLLLFGIVVFFGLRLCAQPFFFDPVFAPGWRARNPVRVAASFGWLVCFSILVLTLIHQFDGGNG